MFLDFFHQFFIIIITKILICQNFDQKLSKLVKILVILANTCQNVRVRSTFVKHFWFFWSKYVKISNFLVFQVKSFHLTVKKNGKILALSWKISKFVWKFEAIRGLDWIGLDWIGLWCLSSVWTYEFDVALAV